MISTKIQKTIPLRISTDSHLYRGVRNRPETSGIVRKRPESSGNVRNSAHIHKASDIRLRRECSEQSLPIHKARKPLNPSQNRLYHDTRIDYLPIYKHDCSSEIPKTSGPDVSSPLVTGPQCYMPLYRYEGSWSGSVRSGSKDGSLIFLAGNLGVRNSLLTAYNHASCTERL